MPEGSSPSIKSSSFFGQVALEVPHEARQLESGVDSEEKVVVIRQHDACVDLDSIEPLGSTENSYEQTVEFGRGSQEESTLYGAIGDLDEGGSRRDETKTTSHTDAGRGIDP